MRSITVRPSAKINLMLRVGPPRPDGFHDVRTLMQNIGISDTLVVSERRGAFALQTRAPGVPADETNLVWKAARALWLAAGKTGEPRDAHVRLDKTIPHEAGLGGGSADAAGAIAALNDLWGVRLPQKTLLRAAASVGSDVPFFLVGGTAIGAGRGDELYPVDDADRLGVVIVKPSFGVGTAEAYRWLDEDRAAGLPEVAGDRVREVHLGWPTDPLTVRNDLEAPVARRRPEIIEIIEACYSSGAQVAAMTGSGSAVFALFNEQTAPKAARILQRPGWLVLVTRTLCRRESTRRIGL
jgi:4-diphosphocytidyl-2-C-methyl-D-erythritol kinase